MTRKKKIPIEQPIPEWRDRFIALVAKTGNVTLACKGAGVSRTLVYQYRKENADFNAAWEAAIEESIETLEAVAWDRARKQSDTLLIFLLKALKPEKYRETTRNEVTGANGGDITIRIVRDE